MKRTFIILFLFFSFVSVKAAYLENIPITVVQPNGDTLHCYVSGDEFYQFMHDAAGYTIIQDAQSGYYVYARKVGDEIAGTSFIAGQVNPITLPLQRGVKMSADKIRQIRNNWYEPMERNRPVSQAYRDGNVNRGTLNNLVVFIRFAGDNNFSTSFSYVDSIFNDSSHVNTNSMYNYFKFTSYNQLFIHSFFYPAPVGETILSYQDTFPRSYYLPQSPINHNGYATMEERTEREFGLLERAILYVRNAIPSSLNLDFNNDDMVDNLCFVVKGTVSEFSSLLWPHRWSLYDRTITINNKRVYDYNFQLEGSTTYFLPNVLSHEMAHTLGSPDFYHYSDNDNISPIARWDLMASTTNPPQQMCAYTKYKYAHWIDSIPFITSSGTYSLRPLAQSTTNNCYIIPTRVFNQFFILEYRKQDSYFDSMIYGNGLVVYRVNTNYIGNADYDGSTIYDELYAFRQDGSTTYNGVPSNSFFSLQSGRTSFSSSTNPYPFYTDGTPINYFRITDISAADSLITFTINMDTVMCDTVTFPYHEGFEDGALPECWEQHFVNNVVGWSYGYGSTAGSIDSSHSGLYNARFYNAARDGARARLVTPSLNLTQIANPQLSFWYAQEARGSDQNKLRIYYKTAADSIWQFLQSYETNVPEWTRILLPLPDPSSDYYIAFEGENNRGYALLLDDITIDEAISSYDITASATVGGSISPFGTYSVAVGDDQTFIITPDENYFIADLLIDSVSVGALSSYTFHNVVSAHTIHAVFERYPGSFTFSSSACYFHSTVFEPTQSESIVVTPHYLSSNITITAPTQFEISVNNTAWSSSLTILNREKTMYVRYNPTVVGVHNSYLVFSASNAQDSVFLSGHATEDTVGIGTYDLSHFISIYPNPADEYITLSYQDNYITVSSIEMYDVYGRLCYTQIPRNNTLKIDLSNYSSGIYFITIRTQRGTITQKIIKERP